MKKNTIVLVIALFLIILQVSPSVSGSSTSKNTEKTALYFSLIPKKDVDQQLSNLQPLLQLLAQKLNRPIKILRPQSYQAVIEGILSQTIDFAILGPASYARAKARDKRVEAFASFARKKGLITPQGSYYYAVLFTLTKREFHSIDALKGKKIAYTDPASTSGFLIPKLVFSRESGYPLETFFDTSIFTGSHDRSISSVINGNVDAAFVSSARLDEAVQKGIVLPEQIAILWKSRPIHRDPFVFSAGVNEMVRKQIKKIILSSPPQIDQMLNKMQLSGIVEVHDDDYQAIHDLVTIQAQGVQ